MDTLLYKVGCVLLFAFIFIQSFSTDTTIQSQHLSTTEIPAKKIIQQSTDLLIVDALPSSIVANETTNYLNESFTE